MAVAQRLFKVSGQCFLMDADNQLMFPAASEFILTHHYRNEEFSYETYGFNNFSHPRRGFWTGEVKITDASFEPEWFSERTVGTLTGSTAGVAFVEMERQAVTAGPLITLDYTPIDNTLWLFDESTRLELTEAVAAADPNVYERAAAIVTMPPAAVVGQNHQATYWRNSSTVNKMTFNPFDQPSAFALYAAQAVAWAASGVKYWVRIYVRSCVPTGEAKIGVGDWTLAFNINNVIEDDFVLYYTPINEA